MPNGHFLFLMPYVLLWKLKFVKSNILPSIFPHCFLHCVNILRGMRPSVFPWALLWLKSKLSFRKLYFLCLLNTDYKCHFFLFVKFILSCILYTSWVTLDHAGWLSSGQCEPLLTFCVQEGLGKAIEIQSISRCQEEIKGQITFLIRAQALR